MKKAQQYRPQIITSLKALAVAITLLSTSATYSVASTTKHFNAGDRKIRITYAQSGSEIKVNGIVSGGPACKQLKIDIRFDNSEKSSAAHIEASFADYTGKKIRAFEDADTVNSEKKYRRGWFISNVEQKCMD